MSNNHNRPCRPSRTHAHTYAHSRTQRPRTSQDIPREYVHTYATHAQRKVRTDVAKLIIWVVLTILSGFITAWTAYLIYLAAS